MFIAYCCFALNFAFSTVAAQAVTDGFVEEVSCQSNRMTVMINKSHPIVSKWINTPNTSPVAYVYGRRDKAECRTTLVSKNKADYNLTVEFDGPCDLKLSNLEPHYMIAETTIAIEDASIQEDSKPIKINHVFCLYTSQVEALKINDISTGHEIVASTGSKPKPRVSLVIRDTVGRNIKAAKFGDDLEMLLLLSPDNAYKAIVPRHCMFSNRHDMHERDAKTLTFVQSSCPVGGLDELVAPVTDIREDIYYTKFSAFRFGNQSTVYAHCVVDVCLTPEHCTKTCFRKLTNNSLISVPRRRSRRQIDNEVAITNAFEVLDASNPFPAFPDILMKEMTPQMESAYIQDFAKCDATPNQVLLVAVGTLSSLLLACGVLVCCLIGKIKKKPHSINTLRDLSWAEHRASHHIPPSTYAPSSITSEGIPHRNTLADTLEWNRRWAGIPRVGGEGSL